MHLSELLNIPSLQEMVDAGYVEAHLHDEFPLVLYTYSRKATYDNMWNDITCKCRGLICDYETGEVIARPFEKFFNLGTEWWPESMPENLPPSDPIVLEKKDGSLGIIYSYKGHDYVASKGSFHSDHADWATEWYRMNVIKGIWPEGYTPVVEMICQDVQKHVVNYKPEDDGLYLLGLVNIQTGEEMKFAQLYHYAKTNGLKLPELFSFSVEECVKENVPNEEGYVLSWARNGRTPLRVKVKFPDFIRLQRLVHHTTPKTILEALKAGQEIGELVRNTTPQFVQWAVNWKIVIEREYKFILQHCADIVKAATSQLDDAERKEYAKFFCLEKHSKFKGILFSMYDQNFAKVQEGIWKQVELSLKGMKTAFTPEDEEGEEC